MKKAFTLAEVLITLGIIGVVAAMTIPTLVTNYQKKMLSTKIKKFVSTFNQAYEMAIVNYGDSIYWKDCTIQPNKSLCTSDTAIYKILNSVKYVDYTNKIPENYMEAINDSFDSYFSGTTVGFQNEKFFQLSDGTIIFGSKDFIQRLGDYFSYFSYFYVDVNGFDKPNRFGKDLFWFGQIHSNETSIYSFSMNGFDVYGKVKRGLYLDGYGYFIQNPSSRYKCADEDITKELRAKCTSLLQNNNWEFPKNYPWKYL